MSSDEIKEYEKLKIISQATPIKEKVKIFENKYNCSFKEFEKKMGKNKENFGEWDDYIEWKAYLDTLEDLQRKQREIENAKHIKITQKE